MPHRTAYKAPGEGLSLNTVDSTALVKVAAEDTADAYELFEVVTPKGPGVPPHRHPWAESYYLLEGELRVKVGARVFSMRPGASLTIPPNAVHAIESATDASRFLAFSLTPGTGRLFADLDRSIPTNVPIEQQVPQILAVAQRNDVTFVGGPE